MSLREFLGGFGSCWELFGSFLEFLGLWVFRAAGSKRLVESSGLPKLIQATPHAWHSAR